MRPECCRPDIGVSTGRPGCYWHLVAKPQNASQHPLGTGWPPGPWSGPPGPPVLRLAPGALLLPLRIREELREEGLWLSAQCASLVRQVALKILRA